MTIGFLKIPSFSSSFFDGKIKIKENQNMKKITLIPLIPAGLGLVISCLVFGRPDYFNLSPQQVNITGIISSIRVCERVYFFIQQYITKRDKILQKRQKHFEKLREVFQEWVRKRALVATVQPILYNLSFQGLHL